MRGVLGVGWHTVHSKLPLSFLPFAGAEVTVFMAFMAYAREQRYSHEPWATLPDGCRPSPTRIPN